MIINTQNCTFSPDSGYFVTEISDIQPKGSLFHRLYDDACDVGVTLLSHKTMSEATYYLHKEERDSECELLVYILYPTTETIRKFPRLKHTSVHILND